MKKSRLYSDWFFDEWWESAQPGRERWMPYPERFKIWERFYKRTFVEGEWTVPIGDAETVAYQGAHLHAQQFDFETALRHLDELNRHPDLFLLDRIMRKNLELFRGICELGLGRFEEGTGRLLDQCNEVGDVRVICANLYFVREPRKGFDPELKPVLAFLIERHFNSSPLLRELEAATTNLAMFALLDRATANRVRSFPRRPKPRP